eukprot:4327720-Prymnesium_polylepis.1
MVVGGLEMVVAMAVLVVLCLPARVVTEAAMAGAGICSRSLCNLCRSDSCGIRPPARHRHNRRRLHKHMRGVDGVGGGVGGFCPGRCGGRDGGGSLGDGGGGWHRLPQSVQSHPMGHIVIGGGVDGEGDGGSRGGIGVKGGQGGGVGGRSPGLCGGGGWQRSPQSLQSLPIAQDTNSAPSPP